MSFDSLGSRKPYEPKTVGQDHHDNATGQRYVAVAKSGASTNSRLPRKSPTRTGSRPGRRQSQSLGDAPLPPEPALAVIRENTPTYFSA